LLHQLLNAFTNICCHTVHKRRVSDGVELLPSLKCNGKCQKNFFWKSWSIFEDVMTKINSLFWPTAENKKFELMLTRRAKAYSS